ncbi:glycoside hydrolase family 28 protein [Granulicella arctica]|uniref:Polygalacturonase n=1 Tax=Granulicella arctica TaxID=940613 RepID=A0A7Y9TEX4_9BACT|nr:glycosyl hydrolase family 28 protein [Granulicella arctica]NYF78146.1 polygalacturonase [Granulicella arctica]
MFWQSGSGFAVRVAIVSGVGMATLFASAQDTRTMTEPVIPPSCSTLPAQLLATNNRLDAGDEGKLDTKRIQAALDACKPGMAVELRPMSGNNAFLSGPLDLRAGVTLLIDEGVTLYASRDPKDYDLGGGLCGTILTGAKQPELSPQGCRSLIRAENVKNAAVMGDGVIDGRGSSQLIGHGYSWWQMARKAEPDNDRYYSSRLIAANHADGFVLYRITLHNAQNFHVVVNGTDGFTAWGVHLQTPTVKGTDARNTDGIDPASSTNITVAHSWIDNGDDNIAIKTGVTHMSVLDNHFYDGHGMSIGSETDTGDSFLLVDGLTEDHTTSGIRIKSNVTRGGSVHDLIYQNICMRDVKNPIAISPYYMGQTVEGFDDPKYTGDKIPDYTGIIIRSVVDSTPGDVLIAGLDEAHRTEVRLDNVSMKGSKAHGRFATVTTGQGGFDIDLSGTEITVVPAKGLAAGVLTGPVYRCEGKFVPMQ